MRLREILALALMLASCGDDASGQQDALVPDALTIDAPVVDAAADSGVACPATPTHVVTGMRVPNLRFGTDAEQTITLPNGFLVQGTVTLTNAANYDPSVSAPGWAIAYDESTQTVYPSYSDTNATNGSYHYSFVLPAGHYRLRFLLYQDVIGSDEDQTYERHVYETIDVCGDSTHDVTVPEITTVSRSVTLRDLDRLGSSPWSIGILYTEPPNDSMSYLITGFTLVTPTAMVTLDVPPEVATAQFYGGEFTGGSLFDLTVPTQVTASGTISNPMSVSVGQLFVQCVPLTTPFFPDGLQYDGLGGSGVHDTYSIAMAQGTNCPLVLVSEPSPLTGELFSPAPSAATSETFSANATRDFTLPDVSGSISLTINLRDSNGQPLRDFGVGVVSESLDGALAGNSFRTFDGDVGAATDSNGQLRLRIPPGTYTLRAAKPF
jgi:hypothetical protein